MNTIAFLILTGLPLTKINSYLHLLFRRIAAQTYFSDRTREVLSKLISDRGFIHSHQSGFQNLYR
jgi:hypothetical protein